LHDAPTGLSITYSGFEKGEIVFIGEKEERPSDESSGTVTAF